jgi:hypothetical protein
MLMPPKKACKVCNATLTDQEAATYGGRCEDCWSAGTDERLSGVFIRISGDAATRRLAAYHKNLRAPSSAAAYSKDLVGELKRITNQLPRRL